MDPVEVFRDRPGLVGLYRADEMPDCIAIDRLDLVQRFLQVILAEMPQAGCTGRHQGFDRLFFADGEDADRLRITACGLCCRINTTLQTY